MADKTGGLLVGKAEILEEMPLLIFYLFFFNEFNKKFS